MSLMAHHKVPRAVSRDDRPSNLIVLCRRCHDQVEELDKIDS
jgi:5-methylcytosine-specific restriction endonuclease McrA